MAKSREEKGKAKDSIAKDLKRLARNVTLDPAHYLVKLPSRPVDLKREHPALYGEIFNDVYGYPMQPPIQIGQVVAIYETFGCRNNDKDCKEPLDLAVPQQVANASPKQQEPMDMMGLMFNFLQTMMNPNPSA